jgi:hypothetical protein
LPATHDREFHIRDSQQQVSLPDKQVALVRPAQIAGNSFHALQRSLSLIVMCVI